MKRPDLLTELVEEQAPEPPAPAVVPGSLEWASAVGNQAVARLAAEQEPAPASEEEAAPAEGEEQLSPEDEEAAAAVAAVDEEQLPES
jgi:hypothetical protein